MDVVHGTEVEMTGHLGYHTEGDGRIFFRSQDGTFYKTVFDAGREARRIAETCDLYWGNHTKCQMSSVKAEILVKGASIKLNIFEVTML